MSLTKASYSMIAGAQLNVLDFGADPTGSADCTSAIQSAVDALSGSPEGGTIYFPVGTYKVTGTIDQEGLYGIRWLGCSTQTTNPLGSVVQFTASSGTYIVNGKSSQGLVFENLGFTQTNVSFTGNVFDFSHGTSALDAAYITFNQCAFSTTASASTINVTQAIIIAIQRCHFYGGLHAILNDGTYANAMTVSGCTFDHGFGTPIISNTGFCVAWVIQGNTFEPLDDLGAAALKLIGEMQGLTYVGNYHGDATQPGDWVTINGRTTGSIENNYFGAGSTSILFSAVADHFGLSITGNVFSEVATAIDLGAANVYGDVYKNRFYNVTTKLDGTPTLGTYQTDNASAIEYKGSHIFDGAVANGVGNTISGTLWAVVNGGSSTNLTVKGTGSGDLIQGRDASNQVFVTAINGNTYNANGVFGTISDERLKDSISDATPKLDDLLNIRVRNYVLKQDGTKTKQIGVVAQELEDVFPGLIDTNEEGYKAVKYSVFVPILIKAVQELSAKVAALEAK